MSVNSRHKLWLENNGQLVMSDYRAHLLELIRDLGSLAQAASAMGLSYRRAWGKVKEIESNLGLQLVQSEVGGSGGGHTSLTEDGLALVEAYLRFQQQCHDAVSAAFEAEVAPLLATRAVNGTG